MIVTKKVRKLIYKNLFNAGVLCAPKNFMIDKTLKDEDGNDVTTRNLFVIKLMTSLKSRGFVKEQFNWQWYYWFITDEGIEYLRKYLNIPAEVLPKTYKQPKVPDRPIGGGGFGGRGGRGFGGGDGGRGYGRGGPRRGDDRVRDAYRGGGGFGGGRGRFSSDDRPDSYRRN